MDERRACSIAWAFLIAAALVAQAAAPIALLLVWFFELPVMLFTGRVLAAAGDERLERPVAYRLAAALALAIPLAGALLAEVPRATDLSEVFAVYFAPCAFFAYRALVARGPRRALVVATFAQLLSLPFAFVTVVTAMGCRCGPRHPPPWTDDATLRAWLLAQLFAMVLVATALVSFRPREEHVAEARIAG